MTPTLYLTPEAIYRLTERLAIDFPDRPATAEEWESAATEAARIYNTSGEPTILTKWPKSLIQEEK